MARYRRRKASEKFAVPIQRTGKVEDVQILPWYWHPDRDGITKPPAAFQAKLREIDPDLGITYSPVHERWLIWVKNARIKHDLCRGWQLLMLWEHAQTKEFLPLTDLVFHNLFFISQGRWPNAQAYFDRIQKEMEDKRKAKEQTYQDNRKTAQKEMTDSWKISSAGKGNRFAMHHDGTMMPGPSEIAWRAETRKARMPAAQIQREKDEKEQQVYS